jgi:hypothetical protein
VRPKRGADAACKESTTTVARRDLRAPAGPGRVAMGLGKGGCLPSADPAVQARWGRASEGPSRSCSRSRSGGARAGASDERRGRAVPRWSGRAGATIELVLAPDVEGRAGAAPASVGCARARSVHRPRSQRRDARHQPFVSRKRAPPQPIDLPRPPRGPRTSSGRRTAATSGKVDPRLRVGSRAMEQHDGRMAPGARWTT